MFRIAIAVLALTLAIGAEPSAKITDFSFLTGHWKAAVWEGVGEEIWSPASGGNMMGMFRFQKQDKLAFTEFLTLDETAFGVVLQMRHFYPTLKAWEDKDGALVWKVAESGPNFVVFARDGTRMRYSLDSPDSLTATLIRTREGKTQEDVFRYKRVK